MSDHQEEFTIGAMSRVLRVTRQGYYAWLQRDPSDRALEDAVLRVAIRAIHKKSHRSYGSRRVREHLAPKHRVGRHRVRRLMVAEGLKTKRSRTFRGTTDSRHTKVLHENVLARDFTVGTLNRAWAGDITYLRTNEGWLYLAVVMDLGSRRVIGWSFRKTLDTPLVTSALDMAPGAPQLNCGSLGLACRVLRPKVTVRPVSSEVSTRYPTALLWEASPNVQDVASESISQHQLAHSRTVGYQYVLPSKRSRPL